MKRFALRRVMEPATTRAQVDAGALQTLVVLSSGLNQRDIDEWEPRELTDPVSWLEVSWIRSYWHAGGDAAMCLYTGPTQEAVEDMNLNCGSPFEQILEVEEFAAPGRTNPLTQHANPGLPGAPLFSVECTIEPGVRPEAALFADLEKLLSNASADALPTFLGAAEPPKWVRTYWREDANWTLTLYATGNGEWLKDVPVTGLCLGDMLLRPVEEIAPADYLG